MKDEFLESLLPDGQSLEEALEEQQSDISNPTGMQRRHNWIRQIEKAGEQQEEDQDG
jgi:hypothetical protein|tara:strand:- start:1332 stop:1502 length:171 start_codon:yes stop_codon:yes gene_type:complete